MRATVATSIARRNVRRTAEARLASADSRTVWPPHSGRPYARSGHSAAHTASGATTLTDASPLTAAATTPREPKNDFTVASTSRSARAATKSTSNPSQLRSLGGSLGCDTAPLPGCLCAHRYALRGTGVTAVVGVWTREALAGTAVRERRVRDAPLTNPPASPCSFPSHPVPASSPR